MPIKLIFEFAKRLLQELFFSFFLQFFDIEAHDPDRYV